MSPACGSAWLSTALAPPPVCSGIRFSHIAWCISGNSLQALTLLLLDEALEGLAPVVVSRFIEAVNKIKQMGVSILIAESNLANAARVADRMYAIDRGEIIFHGKPQEALDNEEVMKALRG